MAWDRQKRPDRRVNGYAWKKLREQVLERDKYLCVNCRKRGWLTKANQVDHIVERSKGGKDDLLNLQSLCEDCHKQKTAHRMGLDPRPRIGLDGWPEGEGG